jgi:hypothetical protein
MEKGTSPMELALGIFLLVFPMALLVLGLAPWAERRNLAHRVATEAARIVALDPREGVRTAVAEIELAAGTGSVGDVRVSFCGRPAVAPGQADPMACSGVGRGGTVTVSVTVDVPSLETPLATIGGMQFTAIHSESVDPYRSFP